MKNQQYFVVSESSSKVKMRKPIFEKAYALFSLSITVNDLSMHHKFVLFPFAAIVGQELMKKALLVNAIDPKIGGVLIRGDKGTGKSTAVRALAELLPKIKVVEGCPFNCDPENPRLMCKSCQERYHEDGKLPWIERKMEVVELPLSATEDMVVGTIDIKRALKEGIKALEPGILARANRNILYVDEVNLLEDHIVNILLDAAAMGVNIIEREGISLYHPSRFILIGTMNPEEGELRPQLLDRFGLCVDVSALSSKEDRLLVMKYRRMFDEDPWRFEEAFRHQQEELREKIVTTQQLIGKVTISDEMLEKIVDITTALGIRTHRADIVMEKTSRVLAALDGRQEVTEKDIREAAILSLTHRIKQKPFEKVSKSIEDTIDSIMGKNDQTDDTDFDKNGDIKRKLLESNLKASFSGREGARESNSRGIYLKARESENPRSVAIDATIRKAVRETGKLEILPEHIMEKIRISSGKALYVIILDTSSSMRMDRKIRFAKSLAWSLLRESYENKNYVSLIIFRNSEPEVLVYPTANVEKVIEVLESVRTNGKTPLTPAIYKAYEITKRMTDKFSRTFIIISDGRANIFIKGDLEKDIEMLSGIIKDVNFVVINTEGRMRSVGTLERLSEVFNGKHFYLDEILV